MKILKGKLSKEAEELLKAEDIKLAREQAFIRRIKEQRKQYDYLKTHLKEMIILWFKQRFGGDRKK